MVGKIGKIIASVVLSFVVAVVTGIVCAWAAGYIVGSTLDANGDEVLAGGSATGLTIFAICAIVGIGFGIWFYRYVHLYKQSKTEE